MFGASQVLKRANPVVFAVCDIDRPAMHEHGMRSRQLAFGGIAIGSVTALAGSDGSRNYSCAQIDPADDMILAVRDEHDPVIGYDEPFWPRQASRR